MNFELAIIPYKGVDRVALDTLVHDLIALGIEVRMLAQSELPSNAYHRQRQQYRADVLLEQVRSISGGRRLLAVTDCDLYANALNFVFGIAESPGRAAIISLHRLSTGADAALFRERAIKEAVHELGHTFGLRHCSNPECVMCFSNSLADTDRKSKVFCQRCQEQLKVSEMS